jgi:hypothetical protein
VAESDIPKNEIIYLKMVTEWKDKLKLRR